jgi:hypothetical protein
MRRNGIAAPWRCCMLDLLHVDVQFSPYGGVCLRENPLSNVSRAAIKKVFVATAQALLTNTLPQKERHPHREVDALPIALISLAELVIASSCVA